MKRLACALGFLCMPVLAHAHSGGPAAPSGEGGLAAILEIAIPVIIAAGLYLGGALRLRGRKGQAFAAGGWRTLAFFAGLALLALSLLPPLDAWSAESFAFHMVQHEALMLLAAPLLVLGRPLPIFLWAFPLSARTALARSARSSPVRKTWSTLTYPLTAWTLHALVLWVWHAPGLFDAALTSRPVHTLQHVSFLLSALLFWTALFEERAKDRQGAGVLYLFTTTVHTGVLGALLAFATQPWYQAYLTRASEWGFSPLEDQQLGGLIMWVPASLVYVGVGLALIARWIEPSQKPCKERSSLRLRR